MNKVIILCVLVCAVLSSCHRESLSNKDFYKLKNSTIVFPSSMESYGKLLPNAKEKPYQLLIYRDSMSCTPCYVKSLDNWKEFLASVKSDKLNLVFVLSPSQDEYVSVKSVLHSHEYKYSIYIDRENEFGKSNPQIPEDEIYHCMLLDVHHKVIIIGNPMKNKAISKMIIKRVNSN